MQTRKMQFICLLFLLISSGIFGQHIVRGKVVASEDNQPLPGVSVAIQGTTRGTITDFDGNYSIEAPENGTLVFTFIGYQSKNEAVNRRTVINVSLTQDNVLMDEIIVMGYSSIRKAELSSSVVTISSEQLTDVKTHDIGNMLQGKVAGLMVSVASGQPGTNAEMRIRGTGSITALAKPLFVVDGIPGGSYNPNDVETVTILKDAGATAIYGADGAGGVIVITTKQAARNQPTRINLKASYGQKHALQGKFEMMNGQELFDTHKLIYSPTLFALQRPAALRDRNFDWLNTSFRPGHVQNYYLSSAGSSEKVNYFASLDYYQEEGTLINTNYERATGRVNLNTKLYDNLDLSLRLSYNTSNNRQPSSYIVLEGAYRTIPWDNPYDAEGNLVKIDGDTRPDNGQRWYTQDKRNFLHGEQYNYAKSRSEGFTADIQLNWNIADWLIFTTTNRYSTSNYKYRRFIDPRTYDPSWSNGYTINNIGQYGSIGTTNLLKANKEFDLHSVSGLIGFEYGTYYSDYTSAAGTGMPNGIDGLTASIPQSVDGYYYPGSGYSWFGQLQYSFVNKYFLTASFRADASSKFSKNYPVGYFPGAAASWLISNEEFLSGNSLISFLKARASYGVTGNSNIDAFQSIAMYELSTTYQDNVGAVLVREANPNLTWESAHMTGLGVDVSFWNKLHVNLDVYNIDNKNLLLNVPRSPSTGFEYGLENIGQVRNRGLEIQLSSDNIKTKDLFWNTSFNIGFNNNEVISLPDNKPITFTAGSSSITQEVRVGQDLNSWYLPKWLGVNPDNGDPMWEKLIRDVNGNIIEQGGSTNVFNEAGAQVVGKATPKFVGGFTNTLSYKGISLYFAGSFVYGNSVYNRDRESYDADGAYLGYNMMRLQEGWSRWEKPGDIATHPKPVMNGNKHSNRTSSRYLEDGSFLRIKNISLSYDIPRNIISKAKLNSCKVYLSGDNMFTFTKFSGLDPEVSLQNSQWSLAGMYSFNYPISRQILIGFDINF